MSSEPSKQSFWTSAPGFITAIAGLITALVGVAALIYQINSSSKASPPASAATSNPVAPSIPSAPSNPPATTASSASGYVASAPQTVALTGNGIDLDVDPPVIASTGAGSDVYKGGTQIKTVGETLMASWTGASQPGREDCDRATQTGRLQQDSLATGRRYCVRTMGGNFAYLQVKDQVADNFNISIITWRRA